MCTDCFEKEYKSFKSEQEWLDFDLELVKKLGSNKMLHISLEPIKRINGDDNAYLYKCLNCKTKWQLRDPDHGYRGYFLKIPEIE